MVAAKKQVRPRFASFPVSDTHRHLEPCTSTCIAALVHPKSMRPVYHVMCDFVAEKVSGEHQLAPSACDEVRKIYSGLQDGAQDSPLWKGYATCPRRYIAIFKC